MWTFVIAPILSLLPRRWRQEIFGETGMDWAHATLISGFVIGIGCLLGLIAWFLFFIRLASAEQAGLVLQGLSQKAPPQGATGAGMSYAMGLSALVAFLMQPMTWVLGGFAIDGFFRGVAALVTGESPGTLPLAIVAWATGRLRRRAYEARVPLVADQVTRGGEKDAWALRVASCRQKPEWIFPLTIRYQGEYFQIAGQAPTGATQARPNVYLLNRPPAGEAYRGVREYDPEALLQAPEEQPNFLAQYLRDKAERWRLKRLPRVPDVIERGDGGQGWHLKIESFREKPEWKLGRTIRFEEEMFRVSETFRGSEAQPFGYRLRKLLENEAARGVIDY